MLVEISIFERNRVRPANDGQPALSDRPGVASVSTNHNESVEECIVYDEDVNWQAEINWLWGCWKLDKSVHGSSHMWMDAVKWPITKVKVKVCPFNLNKGMEQGSFGPISYRLALNRSPHVHPICCTYSSSRYLEHRRKK